MIIIPGDEQDLYISKPDVDVQRPFEDWLESESSCIITTSGGQGVGKSPTCRALFRKLKRPSNLVAYFSFTRNNANRNSFGSFLASVIFQVLTLDPERFSRVKNLFEAMQTSNTWTEASLLVLFRSLLDTRGSTGPLHLIIDDLHNCDSAHGVVMALAAIISNSSSPTKLKVALFYDWKEYGDNRLEDLLQKFDKYRMHGPVLTIGTYKPLVASIVDHVISNRPYLSNLQSLLSESLGKCKNTAEVLITIQYLDARSAGQSPLTLNSLESIIKEPPLTIFDEVKMRYEHLSGWGRIALGWILHCKRPLSLAELATAVTLTDKRGNFSFSFDPKSLPVDLAADIRSVFGSLVRYEGEGVVFSDKVVRTHFLELIAEERKSGLDINTTSMPKILDNVDITGILLRYFSWQELASALDKTLRAKSQGLRQPPGELFDLIDYAVRFTALHYRACEDSDNLPDLSQSHQLAHTWLGLNSILNSTASHPHFCLSHPLFLASQLGLTRMIKSLKYKITGIDRKTAIRLASWGGHVDTVRELLIGDCVVHSEMVDTADALEDASVRGYDAVVRILLNYMKDKTAGSSPLLVDRLLCKAAEFGCEEQASQWIQLGADINAAPYGVTPLQYATRNGHASLVSYLLNDKEEDANSKARIDVNSKLGTKEHNPILLAAMNGYESIVQHLLMAGADITCLAKDNTKRTSLYFAAEYGNELVVQNLLSADKPENSIINLQDSSGSSPLMVACMKGHTGIIKLLLQADANVTLCSKEGENALYYALRPGSEDFAMEILIRTMSADDFKDIADVFYRAAELGFERVVRHCLGSITMEQGKKAMHRAASNGHLQVVELLLQYGVEVDSKDSYDLTPLSIAAEAGEADIVKLLLKHNANACLRFSEGETILGRVALLPEDSTRHADVVNLLLEASGIDPNEMDHDCCTALHRATVSGNFEIIKTLLRHPIVNPNITDKRGWNALHFLGACKQKSTNKIAELLIRAGTDMQRPDNNKWLPIHVASQNGNIPLMEVLWEHNPDCIEAEANNEHTALHLGLGNIECVKWLMEHNAHGNARNFVGRTPIMRAARQGFGECVRVLLDYRCDAGLADKNGQTALHFAVIRGNIQGGRELLKNHMNILSSKDKLNLSSLHHAIIKQNTEFVTMFLDEFYPRTSKETLLDDLRASATHNGETPLITAVKEKQVNIVRQLLRSGAETEHRDKSGKTALVAAVRYDKHTLGSLEMLNVLLDPEAQNRVDVNAGGGTNSTAIHEAAKHGKLRLCKELIKLGAQVNKEGGEYNTALSAAAASGYSDLAVFFLKEQNANPNLPAGQFANSLSAALSSQSYDLVMPLLEAGVDVNATDIQGRSALHIATRLGNWSILSQLLGANGKRPPTIDKQGRTMLHYAAMRGERQDFLRVVADEKLDWDAVDIPDVDGWTPLHWACRQDENYGVVEALVGFGADFTKATDDGWTPENIAITHGAAKIVDFIQSKIKMVPTLHAVTTSSEDQTTSRPTRWKVGHLHYGKTCDGCFLSVRQESPVMFGLTY